ncbi:MULTISPECIES: tautomerase family protein [unclassified Mannheimia]|uniref:tautomerase family protein n=1 Tax=unclassified Mannheimia TaxID=2645054 RepID=UPI00359DB3D3
MISIYGLRHALADRRAKIAEAIFYCMEMSLGVPKQRHALRFELLDREDFYPPINRSENFIVIEINLMQGRSEQIKKRLIKGLFSTLQSKVGIMPMDVEITIKEQPEHCWGFRGMTGNEATDLEYQVHR